jgi:hypothetical protein
MNAYHYVEMQKDYAAAVSACVEIEMEKDIQNKSNTCSHAVHR